MEKLYWAELRKAIAQRINADEQEVAQFMSALAPAITKALREDRQVRISNFGTFKLQAIAPRKSVNVNTGETFTIPGYEKLTFSPESSVKELIGNLGASTSIPNPLLDDATPLRKLGEQASEIVDILSDLGQSPTQNPVQPSSPAEEPTVEEPAAEEEPTVEEPAAEAPQIEEPIITNTTMTEETTTTVETTVETPKKNRTWLVVGITVLIFALLLALLFLFVGNRFVAWVESLHDKGQQTEVVVQVEDVEATPVEEVETAPVSTLPYPYEYKEFIAQERLPNGSRLAWLARKYYGERDLWVFIYEANKNVVQHPSDIKIGTLIRIPKLPDELRDFSNPELRELVDRLAEEYKKL